MAEIIKNIPIEDERIRLFYALKENQLFRINEPELGVFVAESPEVIKRALECGYEPLCFLAEEEQLNDEVLKMTSPYEVPMYLCGYEELKTLVGYHMSRGLLAAFKRREMPSVEEVCRGKNRIVVLENIMNPTTAGAIIRSAAALGIEGALFTSGCADPLQRRASRVSMGNIFNIPWTYMKSHLTNVALLQSLGFSVASMAIRDDALRLGEDKIPRDKPLAIVMGTEGEGLDPATIKNSDLVIKIPMYNGVDSLNVAAASAVVFWEVGKYEPV